MHNHSHSTEAGQKEGAYLARYATIMGFHVAKDFLERATKAQPKEIRYLTNKEQSDGLTIAYQLMVNRFIISLLRQVQKTHALIAATGLLTEEGIPWDSENFEPEEIFAEADRLLREAEREEDARR